MSILIKNFGDDASCKTLEQFKLTLLNKYKFKSVTIVCKTHSGLSVPTFVDVLADGTLIGTYDELPKPHAAFFEVLS